MDKIAMMIEAALSRRTRSGTGVQYRTPAGAFKTPQELREERIFNDREVRALGIFLRAVRGDEGHPLDLRWFDSGPKGFAELFQELHDHECSVVLTNKGRIKTKRRCVRLYCRYRGKLLRQTVRQHPRRAPVFDTKPWSASETRRPEPLLRTLRRLLKDELLVTTLPDWSEFEKFIPSRPQPPIIYDSTVYRTAISQVHETHIRWNMRTLRWPRGHVVFDRNVISHHEWRPEADALPKDGRWAPLLSEHCDESEG